MGVVAAYGDRRRRRWRDRGVRAYLSCSADRVPEVEQARFATCVFRGCGRPDLAYS
jgi:hypothetical protein